MDHSASGVQGRDSCFPASQPHEASSAPSALHLCLGGPATPWEQLGAILGLVPHLHKAVP